MKMYSELKEASLSARKEGAKDWAALIIGVLADVDTRVLKERKAAEKAGEEYIIEDKDVIAVIKSQSKSLRASADQAEAALGPCDQAITLRNKAIAIETFLPEPVDGDELRLLIQSLEPKNIGDAMKKLKESSLENGFDYDGKEASKIAREICT